MLARTDLSAEEIDLLRSLKIRAKQVPKGQDLVDLHGWPQEGDARI
jgi:hypothetical protein